MITLKTIYKTLWKSGAVLIILTIMLLGAISIFSISQKGKIYYGSRCVLSLDNKAIDYLNQDEIIAYDYDFKCNTLYLDLNVDENITKEKSKALLVRISSYYKSINFNSNTQVSLKGNDYLILASLMNGEVSMTTSTL